MTDATIGYGTTYEIKDPRLTPAAFVELAEVKNVTPGATTVDRVEATHMKSPGRRREYVAGLVDSGEASFEINWIPGNETDELIVHLMNSGATVDHRITFQSGKRVTFEAQITGYERDAQMDDVMTATVTVSVSGDEVWDEAP